MTKVGIVLVNYQDYAARFLSACRDSLRRQKYPLEYFKVYIVDNASSPESHSFLQANYPEAIILSRADGNYAAANNLGFSRAVQDGCRYLVSVNMDTEMSPEWLSELVLALDKNPDAAIAQSKILLYPRQSEEWQRPKINSLGNLFHFLGFGLTSAHGEPDRDLSGYPEIKGYASGCSFIIRSEAWEAVGGYNEDFYMYHDDVELSLKVRLSGRKIILAPRSVIYHKYEFKRSTAMLYYMERNRWFSFLSFYPGWIYIVLAPPFIVMQLGLLVYSAGQGWLKTNLAVYAYFFRFSTYAKIYRYRRQIKNLSKINLSSLAKDFCARIEFQEIDNPLLKWVVNPCLDLYWRLVRLII